MLYSKVNFFRKLGTFLKAHLPQGILQKNKSMLVKQFSGCSNELKLIKKPLTGCKLIQKQNINFQSLGLSRKQIFKIVLSR